MIRVLIVHSNNIFTLGVENLLTRETDLRVRSTALRNRASLVREIASFRPEVVIWDESLSTNEFSILMDCIKHSAEIRIMGINTRDNRVNIFDKQELQIHGSADLVAAIRKGSGLRPLAADPRSLN